MITQINILLFGAGKVGSQLVNKILAHQPLLLKNGIDLRVSIVVSSSLLFVEKKQQKNTWEVTLRNSVKDQIISDVVSYIQENKLSSPLVIDATKGTELIEFYAYFLQNTFDVIAINPAIHLASQRLLSEIKTSSDVYGSKLFKFASTALTKNQIVELVFEIIAQTSKHKIQVI